MLRRNRDMDLARSAFQSRDPELSRRAHQQMQQEKSEPHNKTGDYVKSMVYGGLDGLVSAFAVISTGFGANFASRDIVGIGLSSMIVEGLAMGLSDYFSEKAEEQYQQKERDRETWQVEQNPEGQMEQMIEIYTHEGMTLEDAKFITHIFAKYKEPWVDVMLIEELGIIPKESSAAVKGAVTFAAFVLFRTFPFLPYILALFSGWGQDMAGTLFSWSIALAVIALFSLGVIKSAFSIRVWYLNGLQSLAIGTVSATIGYIIGKIFEDLPVVE